MRLSLPSRQLEHADSDPLKLGIVAFQTAPCDLPILASQFKL